MPPAPKIEYWVVSRRGVLQWVGLAFTLGLITGMVAVVALFGIVS